MKTYLISKVNFLEWYFESGQDSENELIKEDFMKRLVSNLFNKNKFQITTRDIFNECNKNAIRLEFIDGFNIDYNEEGEELGDLKFPEPKNFHKITFKDNGIGFAPEYSQRIFELFSRWHNKDEIAGTGIGLAICKKIVDNHKGFISGEGNLGEGAVFTVYLLE